MKRLWRWVRYALGVVLLLALLALGAAWWMAWRALPQLDGTAELPELQQEVTVDRDRWGVPRIRGQSLEDVVTAQGYVMAQDRLWQMDVLRRAAAGELSEIFGPATLDLDRDSRILGLQRAAARSEEALDPQSRMLLEAYARGVNRYIQQRSGRLPVEFIALRYQPRPWRPSDTALIGAYMYRTLTLFWRSELNRALVTARVGAQRASELFVVDAPLDFFVVDGAGAATQKAAAQFAPPPELEAAMALLEPSPWETLSAGSNNWVVDGQHTYSGKPLLANDMHLQLDVPSIWYMVHLTAPGLDVNGFALPGVPLVVAGHNQRLAWGFTNSGADVQDLYVETFHTDHPKLYRANGEWVAAEVRTETIRVRGRPDEQFEVVTTRHGPVVQREGHQGYALRWVATEPGGLGLGYPLLGLAQNWHEFRETLRRVPGPSQNVVYADVAGNIGYVMTGWIPRRKTGNGATPVPGETDDHEWTGYIPFDELPQSFNPPEGIIATANARTVGPRYPHHLTDRWVSPYRTARIVELLRAGQRFRPEDFLRIQTDVVSLHHRAIAEHLVRAAATRVPNEPRARALVEKLRGWDGRALAESIETSFVEFTRRELIQALLQPHLGDQVARYTSAWFRSTVFLENVLRDRPGHWLPPGVGDYDELLMRCAEQAVQRLEQESRQSRVEDWRWGRFLRLQMLHPIGRSGLLHGLLSMPAVEQSGTSHSVKQTAPRGGVSQRFVADLADWDRSLAHITTGQSGQLLSRHYRDQFPVWQKGRGLPSPFSDAAWEKARVHRLRLVQQKPRPRTIGSLTPLLPFFAVR